MIQKMRNVTDKLKKFVEDEGRSCSMDYGCITPLYIYRMWGGVVSLEEIAISIKKLQKRDLQVCNIYARVQRIYKLLCTAIC